ncbi:MAG: hypothetical protein JST12_00955 [Armatimonadetes bacterium]|nr:hypothetical protein [Armatimonadota bacterium]
MITGLIFCLAVVPQPQIDASTLVGKVLCGYQGWFRTPGDPTGSGWFHWSKSRKDLDPSTLNVELWPDMSEYPDKTLFPAGSLKYKNGTQAKLFSSAYPEVVDLHFRWMRQYGIDGVMVQRFLGGLDGGEGSEREARVLRYARDAANRTGRTFAVEYDMSGTPPDKAIDQMKKDWRYLVDTMHITDDPRYLHHKGKPVLEIFGFFTDRFSGKDANAIIDAFDTHDKYAVSLVGAGQWWWRKETDPEWSRAFRRFVAYSPWDVGNTGRKDGHMIAPFARWSEDMAEAKKAGMLLFPVIYPGFSWDNLTRKPAGSTIIPRRDGAFFNEQFRAAADLGVGQAFIAMFDEVDEGTAIFKVSNDPPVNAHFVTLDGLPSDTYLKLAGEGTKLIHEVADRH